MPAMSDSPPVPARLSATLLHELPAVAAERWPERVALSHEGVHLVYAELQKLIVRCAAGLRAANLQPGARVAVFLEKRFEAVVASFAATAAGGVLVPVNPVLRSAQVSHILEDSGAQVLVTSSARQRSLQTVLAGLSSLRLIVSCDDESGKRPIPEGWPGSVLSLSWDELLRGGARSGTPALESDIAAIFYTSGSTGKPKGVVLSHRNLVAGASSVASYLENQETDTLLAALPLSFDAGFSQLTTAFTVGARVVLLNYLLPKDVLRTMAAEGVTGLTAVPPLYMQLASLDWPPETTRHLRYFANTGGRMPRATLDQLRRRAPQALPYLMYGLTEAFRSTYLPPDEVDRRPDSIGRAIPNVDVRVLREDGSECDVDEPGELVHRGPLVALGYWRREQETAERFKPLPAGLAPAREGLASHEIAVFSGDTVRRDADGYLYFVGRRDEMIKTSGYRVSPTEVEEGVFASGLVHEVLAVGVPHDLLGQAIHVAAVPSDMASGDVEADTRALLAHCRATLPGYMVPAGVFWVSDPLPRNPNGKLDRRRWMAEHEQI
jgi:acyl-CoA ligase (AMP-forming) (exosortase A-associated)